MLITNSNVLIIYTVTGSLTQYGQKYGEISVDINKYC